jgi:periplasmic copper chaperone A
LFKIRYIIVLLALAFALGACAPAEAGNLQVKDVWARPGLAGGNSAVYFVIENGTGADDILLSAASDIAGAVELHMTSMQDGAMQMMPQQDVPVPAGATEFKPGGLHVMLIGLEQDLNPGDTFSVALNFETVGEVLLEVTVNEP